MSGDESYKPQGTCALDLHMSGIGVRRLLLAVCAMNGAAAVLSTDDILTYWLPMSCLVC